MIGRIVECKKAILERLYNEKIERPNMYFGNDDLTYLEEEKVVKASLLQLNELGYIEEYQKTKHYRLTVNGALFCEGGGL